MAPEKISKIRADLLKLESRGKLEVLAAVAGIPIAQLVKIMRGQVTPSAFEVSMIEMMR